ncbi:MAG TPA: amidohydrolase family protein [Actinomycetota bacterium]
MDVDAPLIDHHCHGVVAGDLDRPAFDSMISESFDPAPAGTSALDSPIGLTIRRWCSPMLDLDPFASPDAYLARRAELGAAEVNRRLLRACGLEALLIDTGYRSSELLDVAAMAEAAGVAAYPVVRLEAVAEAVAASGVTAAGYAAAFEAALEEATANAVGLKTVVAYRAGFGFDPSPPSKARILNAAGAWLRSLGPSAEPRVSHPTLLRFGIWTGARLAAARGFPLQIHTGFGDPDLTIHQTNPSLLTELVRRLSREGVDVIFLHCYPYHREAGYLAKAYPNVHLDVGASLNHVGAGAARLLREALEVAPFSKHLYSSDAFGLAELYYAGAQGFRYQLGGILDGWIGDGECSTADAESIAELLCRGNARRIYPLPA